MALLDSQFVSRIVRYPEEDWLGCGVAPKMLSANVRPVFEFIKKEATSGEVPKRETILQFFPNFIFKKMPEKLDFYARKILDRFTARRMTEAVKELTENLRSEEPNIEEARELLVASSDEISQLCAGKVVAVDYGRDPKARLAAYAKCKAGMSADFSLGHQVWDEDLIGAEKGNFFLIAGTPGSGKTWLLLKTLYTLWVKENLNILVFSYELPKSLMQRRLDCIIAGVEYKLFRRGMLTEEQFKMFSRKLGMLSRKRNYFKILTTENSDPFSKIGPNRLEYVYSKIKQLKPDVVAIDGFYLMDAPGDGWEKMAYLSRRYHAITQATGVYSWATTQLGKTGDDKNPKLKDISFSWTFIQDTDGVFLLSKPDDGQPVVTVGKFREAEDKLRYAMNFLPGAKINIERMAPPTENFLMD